MKYKIIWYDEAVEELDKIYNFYFDKSPHAAGEIYQSILDGIENYIKYSPKIAPIEMLLENKKEVFRSMVVYHGLFKIIYFISSDSVVVTHIWCCRQNPEDLK